MIGRIDTIAHAQQIVRVRFQNLADLEQKRIVRLALPSVQPVVEARRPDIEPAGKLSMSDALCVQQAAEP